MEEVAKVEHPIREEKIIAPLAEILEHAPLRNQPNLISESKTVSQSLNELFPEQEIENKKFKKAKEILGSLAHEFSDADLREVIAQVEYLAESWVDDFERDIFDGLTLKEVLHERSKL
jgi:hypothetical protein